MSVMSKYFSVVTTGWWMTVIPNMLGILYNNQESSVEDKIHHLSKMWMNYSFFWVGLPYFGSLLFKELFYASEIHPGIENPKFHVLKRNFWMADQLNHPTPPLEFSWTAVHDFTPEEK